MPTQFLDLPRELRDQIYAYVLISRTGFVRPLRSGEANVLKFHYHVVMPKPNFSSLYIEGQMSSGILTTCMQIYHEWKDIFLRQNVFIISRPTTFSECSSRRFT